MFNLNAVFYRTVYKKIKNDMQLAHNTADYYKIMQFFVNEYPKVPADVLADIFVSTKNTNIREPISNIVKELASFQPL